jgi:hypothetical protein
LTRPRHQPNQSANDKRRADGAGVGGGGGRAAAAVSEPRAQTTSDANNRRFTMPPSPLALRRAAAAGVLALLLAVLVVALLIPSRHQQQHPNNALAPPAGSRRPLLVIDAGSSGTRVHAFRLELAGARDAKGGAAGLGRRGGPAATSKSNHHHPFAVRAVDVVPSSAAPDALPTAGDGKRGMYDRVETRPGLDQVVAGPQGRADPEAVLRSRALGPLLDWASAALRATAAEERGGGGGGAPVFFGGTGGLRRMPPRDRERLLEAARHVLRSDARLAFEGGGGGGEAAPTTTAAAAAAGVLPGAREAAFGWVATNWARGLIKPPLEQEKDDDSAQLPKTMGVLDLGGASLEVAFEVEDQGEGKAAAAGNTGGAAEEAAEEEAAAAAAAAAEDPFARPPSAVVELRVGGAGPLRRVHTHAFHGYGLNEAFDRAVARLLEEQQQQQEEEDKQQQEAAAAAELAPTRRSGGGGGDDEQRREQAPPVEEAAAATTTTTGLRAPPPQPLALVTPRRRRRLSSDSGNVVLDTAAAEAHAADAAVAAMQAPRPSGRVAVGNGDGNSALLVGGAGAGAGSVAPAPPPTPVVRHPCLHAGYEAPYERIAHRHSHHADPEQQAAGEPGGGGAAAAAAAAASPAAAAGPPVVNLVGAPDWPACRRLMAAVVDAGAPCARHPRLEAGEECRLGALQPALKGRRFAALSGFDAVWRFLGADPVGGTAALLQAAERWCSVSWPFDTGLAAQIKPDAAHSVNGERYCAWAPYAASLLSEGLGLSDGEFDIGGNGEGGAVDSAHARLGTVGWPLGAALVEGPRLLEEAATAAAVGGGEDRGVRSRSMARRPLLPMLLLAVLAAGVLGLAIAAFGASSNSPPPPPRGGWVGLGPAAGRGGGGGGSGKGGGGNGNGHGLLPPALLPLHAAPSMLSLRSSSFAPGLAAGASVASSPGSPRAFATSSSFSFGSSSLAPLQPLQVGGGAVPRREASPTLWRSPSPVGIGGVGGGGSGGLLHGSAGSLRGL